MRGLCPKVISYDADERHILRILHNVCVLLSDLWLVFKKLYFVLNYI
jgi:hypothetical protein